MCYGHLLHAWPVFIRDNWGYSYKRDLFFWHSDGFFFISYTSKEVIAKNTVVANVSCHDADKPPDVLHYEPNSGPVGAGMLFNQAAGAKNAIRVSQWRSQTRYDNSYGRTWKPKYWIPLLTVCHDGWRRDSLGEPTVDHEDLSLQNWPLLTGHLWKWCPLKFSWGRATAPLHQSMASFPATMAGVSSIFFFTDYSKGTMYWFL